MANPKITVQLGLNQSGFRAGLAQARAHATNWAQRLGSSVFTQVFGALGAQQLFGTLVNQFERAFAGLREVDDLKQIFGGTAQDVQLLRNAAAEAGMSVDNLSQAFVRLGDARAKAMASGPAGLEAMRDFARLGIAASELPDLDPRQIQARLRYSFQNGLSMDPGTIAALKGIGFGHPGILRMLTQPATSESGAMTDEQLSSAVEAQNSYARFKQTLANWRNRFVAELVHAFTPPERLDNIISNQISSVVAEAMAPTMKIQQQRAEAELLALEEWEAMSPAKPGATPRAPAGTDPRRATPPNLTPADTLAQLGGYVGGAVSSTMVLDVERQQVRLQERMVATLEVIEQRFGQVARSGWGMEHRSGWD